MMCDRCHDQTTISTCSMFNLDQICMNCLNREQQHPRYPEAKAAEERAVKAGNYNYIGIGCPPELRRPQL